MKPFIAFLAISGAAVSVAHSQALPSSKVDPDYELSRKFANSNFQTDYWEWLSRNNDKYADVNWLMAKPDGGWAKALSGDIESGGSGLGSNAYLAKTRNVGDTDELLTAGGFYFATNSIYSYTQSSEFEIGASTPLTDGEPNYQVGTVFLQMLIGENEGNTFLDGNLPQLKITHSEGIDFIDLKDGFYSDSVKKEGAGKFKPDGEDGPEVDLFNRLWGFQWDLRGYTNVSEISVSFGLVTHTSLYQIQLDRTSQGFDYFAVPEPSTYALILGAAVLGLIAVRRRRAK